MLDEPLATRREVDQLAARVDGIYQNGTRSEQLLTGQLDRLTEQVAAVRSDSITRWGEHTRQHSREKRDRAAQRRWRVTTSIAAIVAAATVVGLLLAILSNLASLRR